MALDGPPCILFVASNPQSTEPLQLGEEIKAIEDVLRDITAAAELRFEVRYGARRDELSTLLRRFRPTILHFTGHATPAGDLVFGYLDGRIPENVGPQGLRRILTAVRGDGLPLRCAMLSGCSSIAAADEVTKAVDLCVGSRGLIKDEAARTFARGFYGGLIDGRSFAAATDEGKQMVGKLREFQPADQRPGYDPDLIQLRTRAGVDADKVFLFG